jgi:hypothetical protein
MTQNSIFNIQESEQISKNLRPVTHARPQIEKLSTEKERRHKKIDLLTERTFLKGGERDGAVMCGK